MAIIKLALFKLAESFSTLTAKERPDTDHMTKLLSVGV